MRSVVALVLVALVVPTWAGADSKWWPPVSHPDGLHLAIKMNKVDDIPWGAWEIKGGTGMVGVFAYCADNLDSPLFKELRRLQRDNRSVVLYAKIESARLDSIHWGPDQRLVAVMKKDGLRIPAEQVLACYRPNGEITTENSVITFGGGSILHIFPQTNRGFHPPFLLEDIKMKVVVNGGEDLSRLMIFIVMPHGFKSSKVDHWMVDTALEQAARHGPAKGEKQ